MISVDEINKLQTENKRLNDIIDSYQPRLQKYKDILQEIKAIAEQCMNKDTCYDCEYCDDCYIEDVEIPTYDICKLLVQKITKAEEEWR